MKKTFQWILIASLVCISILGIILTSVGMFQTKTGSESIVSYVAKNFISRIIDMPSGLYKSHEGFVFFGGILTLIISVGALVIGVILGVKTIKGNFEINLPKFLAFSGAIVFIFVFSVAVIACSNELWNPIWVLEHINGPIRF